MTAAAIDDTTLVKVVGKKR